jgi:hypothetical protein
LLKNGSVNTPVARQWLSSRDVMTATDTHTRIEELLEAVFSVWLVPSLYEYNECELSLAHRSSVLTAFS